MRRSISRTLSLAILAAAPSLAGRHEAALHEHAVGDGIGHRVAVRQLVLRRLRAGLVPVEDQGLPVGHRPLERGHGLKRVPT